MQNGLMGNGALRTAREDTTPSRFSGGSIQSTNPAQCAVTLRRLSTLPTIGKSRFQREPRRYRASVAELAHVADSVLVMLPAFHSSGLQRTGTSIPSRVDLHSRLSNPLR